MTSRPQLLVERALEYVSHQALVCLAHAKRAYCMGAKQLPSVHCIRIMRSLVYTLSAALLKH